MKTRCKIAVFFLLFGLLVKAQNLVPNPSFEDTVSCPTNISQLNKTKFWINPTQSSPDYFNACSSSIWNVNVPYNGFGYQHARTGNAYSGIYGFAKGSQPLREYIQVRLTDTLQFNRKYLVSFYVNKSDWSQYSISSLGAYFSSLAITGSGMGILNYTPQIQSNSSVQLSDSINWMLIQDTLLSNGTEEYITIGNFKSDSQSDTTYLGWFSSSNIAYYYIDDVSVIDVEALSIKENTISQLISIYPNPTTGMLNISDLNCSDKEVFIEVTDVSGKVVVRKKSRCINGISQLTLDLNNGAYFIKAVGEDLVERKGKVIISK